MEYKPILPKNNNNVSHDQPVREFVLLLFGVTVFLTIGFWALGLCVNLAVSYISPEIEAKVFSAVSISHPEFEDDRDPREVELQYMVDALQGCANVVYPLKVQLIDSDEVNAMALPGGRLFVLKGLLDKVSSENGLSFVLAHELAHFKNRDHLRGLGRGIVFTAAAALLTGSNSNFTKLLTPVSNLGQAQYSQERESLADQQALNTLDCYYGHVGGATEFFEAMIPAHENKTTILGHYFSSHPEAVQRINNLHQQATMQHFAVKEVIAMPAVLSKQGNVSRSSPAG